MTGLPFYFSKEFADEAREGLLDLIRALRGGGEYVVESDIQYSVDENGIMDCSSITSDNLALAKEMQGYCSTLKQYGVAMDTRLNQSGDPQTFWRSEIIRELYNGVVQVATRIRSLLQEYCTDENALCQELLPLDNATLFKTLFTTPDSETGNDRFLRFLLDPHISSGAGYGGAAMVTTGVDEISVFSSGYGFSGSGKRPIPRYNVSHELMHILTRIWNQERDQDAPEGIRQGIYLSQAIHQLIPTYRPVTIAHSFYPPDYQMPVEGFNNWRTNDGGGIEEIEAEAINILLWQNMQTAGVVAEDFPDQLLGYIPQYTQLSDCVGKFLVHYLTGISLETLGFGDC